MKLLLNLDFEVPAVPNFLRLKESNNSIGEIFGGNIFPASNVATLGSTTIDVKHLSDEAIEDIIKSWGDAFRANVKSRRGK